MQGFGFMTVSRVLVPDLPRRPVVASSPRMRGHRLHFIWRRIVFGLSSICTALSVVWRSTYLRVGFLDTKAIDKTDGPSAFPDRTRCQ